MAQSKPNNKLFLMLRILLLALSVAILVKIVDFRLVLIYLTKTPWYVLLILVLIGVLRTWLTGLRWHLLNPDLSGQLSSWHYFRFYMIANAFNLIMPGALGGDLIRTTVTLRAIKNKRIANVIAIIADRAVGLLSILLLGTIALIFAADIPDRTVFYRLFGAVFLGVAVIAFLITNSRSIGLFEKAACRLGKIGTIIIRVIDVWKNTLIFFKTHRKNLPAALLICLPIHSISFYSAYLLARSLGVNLSFLNISLIIALVWLVTAIPLTLSGAGVRELSMIYLFSIYGVGAEAATALSLYIYIVSILLGLLGLLFIIDWRKWLNSTKRKVD